VAGNGKGWWFSMFWGAEHNDAGTKSITSLHAIFAVPERGEQGRAAQSSR